MKKTENLPVCTMKNAVGDEQSTAVVAVSEMLTQAHLEVSVVNHSEDNNQQQHETTVYYTINYWNTNMQ